MMDEIINIVWDQLQQLQALMHKSSLRRFMRDGIIHNPYRGQGRILAILKMKPEISQRELTYLLNMSKQSIAELLFKLEKNGYITREHSEDDKRVMTVRLTEEGAKAADNVDDSTLEIPKLFDCLNDDELRVFSEYLGRIIKRCEELFPDEDFEKRRRMMKEFISHHDHTRHGRGRCHHRDRGCGR